MPTAHSGHLVYLVSTQSVSGIKHVLGDMHTEKGQAIDSFESDMVGLKSECNFLSPSPQ